MQTFENLSVFKKAEELTHFIYNSFENIKDYGFRDQIQRAAVSIVCNIAEGYERKGNKEYSRFLYIAKGSAGEVRALSHLAVKLGYIDGKKYDLICEKSIEISKMLSGLIKKL